MHEPEAISHEQREWLRVTLSSIGDGVITTDSKGSVTFLNPVAQSLTGWKLEEAAGVPLEAVFKIVNEESRRTVENPATRALREGVIVGLANHTLLIAKDGTERPIDDSAAPIRNGESEVAGVVLVFRDVTERRRQEHQLRDALAYADNIIATLREPFVVLDKSLRVITANGSFYRTFHVSREETERRFLYELGNGQWNIPRLRAMLAEVLSNNHPVQDFEVEHDFPMLGHQVVLLNARRFESQDSRPDLILLAIEDVTERRKSEEAVRQSEERFRRLVEGVKDYAIFMLDPQGKIATWNAGAERIKGYSAEEIIGKHFSCFYPPEIVETGWPERELRAAESEGRFEDEGWRLRKDGSKFWANVVITAVRDESGQLQGFSKITRDLTERNRAEAQIRDSELRYRRLFETARDGILILDGHTGRITDTNPFITELLGYTRGELLDKELWQIGLFQDIAACHNAFRELQERGYIRYEYLSLETKSGKRAEVEFVSNVYQVDGKHVIQCNIRDITERRQLERAKVQAEALADLHRRKDEFLAMLSHELRNPLAPIMNGVQLLSLEHKNETALQHQARTVIERQVDQLKHLVDDLLEVSRITTGRIRLHKENVVLSSIIERAVDTTRPLVDQRRHKLTVVQPPEPIWLHADPTRLEQVVVNLLNNAAKYTNDGGRIQLSVGHEGDQAVLRVRDTGVGIAPDVLPRIFDLFTQAERSLDRSQGGLGIGLSLVQKLVEMHGGRVEAYSSLGHGSEFIVRLPVTHLSVASPQVSSSGDDATRPMHSLRVLVVDDNVDQADTAAMLLRAGGHDVQVAYSGTTALEAAVKHQPKVVVLDIGLPEMDGYEVARRLRQQASLKDSVLIAVTGYGQESDQKQTKAAGFDHHLVKPVEPQKLQEIVASMPRSQLESRLTTTLTAGPSSRA